MPMSDDALRAPVRRPPDAPKTGKRAAVYLGLLAFLAVTLVVRWSVEREPGTTFREAPPETRGLWTTAHPRYADRSIRVTPTQVVLLLGDAGSVTGRIVIARELQEKGDRILRLEFETEDGADALDMVVAAGGTMRLRNQRDVVWSVEGGAAPLEQAAQPTDDVPSAPLSRATGLWILAALLGGFLTCRGVRRLIVARGASGVGAPRVVRGVWTSPDPAMEGRSIRIADEYGFAQFGPGDARIGGAIEGVEQWKEGDARIIRITYRTAEGQVVVEMVIDSAGHMRLRDGPKSLWVRRETAGVS